MEGEFNISCASHALDPKCKEDSTLQVFQEAVLVLGPTREKKSKGLEGYVKKEVDLFVSDSSKNFT